jgi:hypothetical protein
LNPVISKLKKEFKNREIDFFILPDNKNDGNLDSLFLQCATKKITEKSSCVDDYLKCLGAKPSINKKDKVDADFEHEEDSEDENSNSKLL